MSGPTERPGEWRLFETAEAVAEHAAEWLCLCVLARPRDGEVAICLSGGSTPQRLYQRLASAPVASRMPWNRIHWFWGDERFVAHDDPASNYRMAHEALFSRAPVSPDHIHPIPTEGLTPEQAAAAYQSVLQTFYGSTRPEVIRPVFDVTLLGVGEDGHTASLFPGSSALQEERQWVLPVLADASRTRVTLTYPVLNSSRNLAFLATGTNKKKILTRIRTGDTAPPAARIRPIGRLTWFVDRAAMPDWPPAASSN
ncbi:MAG TPA: 6-phosphogluconolactonase [Pseudolabrys sp.]|nr:6-phosphogluconolactonase [Pseudolabrys sp.]